MTLEDIIKEKVSRLETVPETLYSAVEKSQSKIYSNLLELLGKLKTDAEGNFIQSVSNLNTVEKINTELKKVVFGSDYYKAVSTFANEFQTQKKVTNEYFEKSFPEVTGTKVADEIVAIAQRNAVDLLTGSALDSEFFNPIKKQIVTAIETKASFTDTIKAIRKVAIGNKEIEGKLLSHSKQIAHDSFALADRSYTSLLAEDLGAVWYVWSGRTIPTSRELCIENHNKYFHKKEIEEMASKDWEGKMEGTNSRTIFTTAGGYNCGHSILPVVKSRVPDTVIQRNIKNGNYKPKK